MNHFNASCLGVAALLISGCCSLEDAATSSEWMNFPCELLSSEFACKYARKIDSLVEYQFAVALASTYGDKERPEPLESIILLWCQGFRSTVESLWYEKDDRISRCLIMMLVLSDKEDDRLDSYVVKCNRFERHECNQRREEIFWVAKRREAYSGLVKSLMKKVIVLEQSHETMRNAR